MTAPKMLYGPRGWEDLDDYILAHTTDEEADAAKRGYFRSGPDAREDLIASGAWTGAHTAVDRAVAMTAEVAAAAPEEDAPGQSDGETTAFDPMTADTSAVRAFLRDRGIKYGPRTKEDDLRSMALDAMTSPDVA